MSIWGWGAVTSLIEFELELMKEHPVMGRAKLFKMFILILRLLINRVLLPHKGI